MLAHNEVSKLFEQSINPFRSVGNSDQPPKPLPVLSSYSGFVTNQVFDECSPVEIIVFAVIQYLSFFSIKCSTINIAKNLNASTSAIKSARNSLSKRRLIVKQDNGTYLFEKSTLGAPTVLVDAKELSVNHFGYWFPVETLKSKTLTNQEKKSYALMKSLTNQRSRRMSVQFIATKSNLSRVATSRIINRLLDKKLISRHRHHHRSAYIYQTGGQEMSIYKKDLSPHERSTIEQSTQNDTSNGTQNDTPLSINRSNKSFIDISNVERASATYQSGQKKSLFFLKEVIDFLLTEIALLERNKNQEEDAGSLNTQYTKACVDGDLEKIQELRAKMASSELQINKSGQKKGNAETTKAILSDYEHCLKNNQSILFTDEQTARIGNAVKHKVDLTKYENKKTRKRAFCIMFNSVVLDVNAEYKKSKDSEVSIEICLKKLTSDSYDLNYAIISKIVQKQCSGQLSVSNQNWMDYD